MVLPGQEPIGIGSDEGLDPPHPSADRGLREELDDTQLAAAGGVGAAAQLVGPVPHGHHAHDIAVLLAEQRHRAHGHGIRLRHLLRGHPQVVLKHVVDERFGVGQHRCRHRGGAWEIEPEPPGSVLRTHLRSGIAQQLAERPVDHVSGGVGAADGLAAGQVDLALSGLTASDLAIDDRAAMDVQPADRALHVIHLDD